MDADPEDSWHESAQTYAGRTPWQIVGLVLCLLAGTLMAFAPVAGVVVMAAGFHLIITRGANFHVSAEAVKAANATLGIVLVLGSLLTMWALLHHQGQVRNAAISEDLISYAYANEGRLASTGAYARDESELRSMVEFVNEATDPDSLRYVLRSDSYCIEIAAQGYPDESVFYDSIEGLAAGHCRTLQLYYA